MYKRFRVLTMSALILAYGASGAIAQERTTPQPDQQQMQPHPMGEEGTGGMMGRGMMGRGMMGGGMMGHSMMGPPPVMFRIMFALIDSDSDGPSHCRSFRRLTNEYSRQWTPTKMANLR